MYFILPITAIATTHNLTFHASTSEAIRVLEAAKKDLVKTVTFLTNFIHF